MKLRLKGNSIRVRLDRRDIEGLIDRGPKVGTGTPLSSTSKPA